MTDGTTEKTPVLSQDSLDGLWHQNDAQLVLMLQTAETTNPVLIWKILLKQQVMMYKQQAGLLCVNMSHCSLPVCLLLFPGICRPVLFVCSLLVAS